MGSDARSKHIQSIFCEGSGFIEANNIQLSSHVNPSSISIKRGSSIRNDSLLRANAEDALSLKSRKRKISSNGKCGRKSWRHDNRDQVEGSYDNQMPGKLVHPVSKYS